MKINSQGQPPVELLNKEQFSTKQNIWRTAFFILLGLLIVSAFIGYYFVTQNGNNALLTAPSVLETQESEIKELTSTEVSKIENPEELLVVNAHSIVNDERGPYFSFQLKYPSKYLVTSDDMVTPYVSQGGSAPPRLIFTKDAQPLGNINYRDIWSGSGDCILVWSTSGWNAISDFQTYGGAGNLPKTINQQQITVLDSFKADKREVKYADKQSNNLELFVQMPEDVAYFFQTCNMNSENDLEVLINNFKVGALVIEE